jgi:transketolase
MRNNFVTQVLTEMDRNKNIFFLTGDLGFNALESIQKKFPDRFINVGIAEANMIGIAAGLALTGKKVITYSIASFITMRAFEQIRNDVCYHNLDVKIVGTGGGFNYAAHGVTHHTIEDLAIMSTLPHMTVVAPSYAWEAKEATRAVLTSKGPAYLRLGKSPIANYHKPQFDFALGKGFVIRDGRDVLLIITSNILDTALSIADSIKKETGKSTCVVSMPTIKPLDTKLILEKVAKCKIVVTLEEHSLYGGLGSTVAMTLSQSSGAKKPLICCGIADRFIKDVGSREYLLEKAGLDANTVSKKIIKALQK